MAPKTQTAETAAPRECKCGCGEPVTRNFKQGHDMALVSKLAENVVNGKPPNGLGALSVTKSKRPVEERIDLVADMLSATISEAISNKFVNAANRKVEQAKARADRAAKPRTTAHATKAEGRKSRARAAAKTATAPVQVPDDVPETDEQVDAVLDQATETAEAPKKVAKRRVGPVKTARIGLGAKVKIKVRGRVVEAEVAGMNQAGKVTLATYSGAKGVQRRVEDPEVVDPAPVADGE